MGISFLLCLVVLVPSRCSGDEQSFDREQLIPSAYKLSDNTGQSKNKRGSDADHSVSILLEMFKLLREMNGLRDQIENQEEELERLREDYKMLEEKQEGDFDSFKVETKNYHEKLEDLLTETTAFQENHENKFQEFKGEFSQTTGKQERDIGRLMNDTQKLLEYQDNRDKELQEFKSQLSQTKNKQEDDIERLMNDTQKLHVKQDSQEKELQELKSQLSQAKYKQERDAERLMNDTLNLQGHIDDRDTFIHNEVCKARSVKLPSDCTSGECCMKHMIDSIYSCMPTCDCPEGYQVYKRGELCYKFHLQCTTWENARKVCQKEGGDLIMFGDETDITFFQNLARAIPKTRCDYNADGYWVGLTDQEKEGTWKWVNGRLAGKEIPWHPYEPSNEGGKEHFAHLWKNKDFAFNDVGRGHSNSFICAIE